MHILIAVHGFPPVQNAGAEKAAERIADWLVAQGHQVDVFTLGQLDTLHPRLETTTQNGMLVHRLSCNLKSGSDPMLNLYDNPLIGQVMRMLLAEKHFDLVHLVSGYLMAGQVIHTAKRAGVPVVLTLTEYFYMCMRLNLMRANTTLCVGPESDAKCARCLLEEKRRFRMVAESTPLLLNHYWAILKNNNQIQRASAALSQRRVTLKAALEAVDLVICPSNFIIEKYREYGFQTERFAFIRHGVNPPAQSLMPQPTQTDRLRVGYMGQIKAHKGLDLLVSAVQTLLDAGRNIELQIWGRVNDHRVYGKRLVRKSARYPQISWRGGFNGVQVWEVLKSMDVLVVPSRWYENCPTVILEAFRAGIPVVATDLGGMSELVQHDKNGLVFKINSAADLRTQLERLLREPGLLDKLRAGIPYIKTGDEEVQEIFAQYQRLLTGQSEAG